MLLCTLLLSACGEKREDPKEAYDNLVKAAVKGDGAVMYDVLDKSMRSQVDTMVQLQLRNRSAMPPDEKVKWDSIQGLSGREAFNKIVQQNRDAMTDRFKGEYEILKVDTFVVVTVQHAGKAADLMYMRWEDGKLHVSEPPRVDQPTMPGGQMPPGHPQGNMPEGHPNVQPGPAPAHPAPTPDSAVPKGK